MNREDQETLTRVGAGTPMGELLRRYWIPAALGHELVAGGKPRRLMLLGEALVLARDPGGELTALQAACPHRGASLHLGRNEVGGLRCVYHGWKFDRGGQCVDMPNEPEEHRFCEKVRARAYACRERNGLVWVHFRDGRAPLPDLEWNTDATAPPMMVMAVRNCNWLQALEGDMDSSHSAILHARWDDIGAPTVPGAEMNPTWSAGARLVRSSGAPHIEAVDAPYGALYSARRPQQDGDYHRVHPFLFPFHSMIGGGLEGQVVTYSGKAWVPIDDLRTLVLEWQYRPGAPWSEAELDALHRARFPFGGAQPGPDTDYGRDLALEDRMFFGVVSNPLQDAAVTESMGPISDRTHEHLGPADAMIIRVRKRLLQAARALKDSGVLPPGAENPEVYRVRPVGALLPQGADWIEATRARRERAPP